MNHKNRALLEALVRASQELHAQRKPVGMVYTMAQVELIQQATGVGEPAAQALRQLIPGGSSSSYVARAAVFADENPREAAAEDTASEARKLVEAAYEAEHGDSGDSELDVMHRLRNFVARQYGIDTRAVERRMQLEEDTA